MSLRVLLIEDDPVLRATLRAGLEAEGHAVAGAASRADAEAQLAEALRRREPPELLLLDLGLPDGEGEALLARLRAPDSPLRLPGVPVLVISAREDEAGKVRLLDAGADDYLVKPFGLPELLARMRVAWRHRGRAPEPARRHYARDGLAVDLAAHRVSLHGAEVHLTPTEFRLLACLVRSAGRVLTHRHLLAEVWGPECVAHTHYLRLYMAQLRAKLEAEPADPRRLLTEPGVGYRLVEPESAPDEAA